jgi:hypothetical protein
MMRARLLEYHAMHMVCIREIATSPSACEAQVTDLHRDVKKHRDQLIDSAPAVFSLAAVDMFRSPAAINIERQNAEVATLSHARLRASALGQIDSLLDAIRVQWIDVKVFRADAPGDNPGTLSTNFNKPRCQTVSFSYGNASPCIMRESVSRNR